MRNSRILFIFILLITAALGAVAIWIGWRLSQEPEITPTPSDAASGQTCCDNRCEPPGQANICGCCQITNKCIFQMVNGVCTRQYPDGGGPVEWICGGQDFIGAGNVDYNCDPGWFEDPNCTANHPSNICGNRIECNLNESWCGAQTTTTTQQTTQSTTQQTTQTTTQPTTQQTTSTTQQTTQSTTLVTTVPGQPAFSAEKTSGVVCINNDSAAQVSYTITVNNVSTVEGVIDSVTDTYDSRIQQSWVSSITPTPDSHSGNVIEWNNNGNGFTMSGGAQLTFSYVVTIPSDFFGSVLDPEIPHVYRNVAIVQPEVGDAIELEDQVQVNCLDTGIFDQAVTAVLFAFMLIVLGVGWIGYHDQLLVIGNGVFSIWPLSVVKRRVEYQRLSKKEKFERKMRDE